MIRLAVIRLASTLFALILILPLAQALTLDEALEAAPTRTGVVTARTELRNAVANLERVQGDPLAVRADKLEAQQRLALAKANFTQSYYAALSEIESAYTGVLQARFGVQVAQKAASVSQKALEIAQIRVNNGSGTQLDLEEARTSLNEAQNSLRSAQDGLNIAVNNLESILDREFSADSLEGVPDRYLVSVPPLQRVLETAAGSPTVLQAEQQLAAAQLGTEVLDASYASQTQLEGAQTGLTNAQEALQETQRGFRIQARNLYNSAVNAKESYQNQQAALQNANERLQTQRQRFEGGLISQIELSQAELTNLQAESAALQARYTYLTSLLELQSGTLAELSGPATLNAPPPSQVTQGVTLDNAGGPPPSGESRGGTTGSSSGVTGSSQTGSTTGTMNGTSDTTGTDITGTDEQTDEQSVGTPPQTSQEEGLGVTPAQSGLSRSR